MFEDPTQNVAKAAIALGFAHRKFDYLNPTSRRSAVIAAPQPESRELFCRSGLKYYARIKPRTSARRWRS